MNHLAVSCSDTPDDLFRSIVESSREAVLAEGPSGTVAAVNSQFLELTGWTGSLENRQVDQVVEAWASRASRAEVIQEYFKNCRSGTPPLGPHELQPSPGQVVEARFQTLVDSEGVSYRVWFFQEWRTSALAWVSHEIKNPLNAVLGFSDLLADSLGPGQVSEPVRSSLRGLKISANHLQAVIGDLLNLAKLESGVVEAAPRWTRIQTLLDDVHDLFRTRFHRRGLDFVVEGTGDPDIEIWVDQGRLSQILGNLVANALRFTKKGHVAVRVVRSGETWTFQVEDTGEGIPGDQQKTIFEPFVQKQGQDPRRFGGTGLGLAICKTLTQTLGGQMAVESEPGVGSRFSVVLDQVLSRKAPSTDCPVVPGNLPAFTLLVADDEQTNHLLVEGFLRETKTTVISAVDGYQAVELWKLHRPQLMLLDLRMPGLSGLEAGRRIRDLDQGGTTRLLGMSASRPDRMEIAEGWKLWAGFIEKPFAKQEFLSFLSNHISFVDESANWT